MRSTEVTLNELCIKIDTATPQETAQNTSFEFKIRAVLATWFSGPFVFLLEMDRITRNLLTVKPFAERQQMPWGRGWRFGDS